MTIYVFEIFQCVSFYLQGYGFNTRFFHHFSFSNIKLSWSAYPEIPLCIILFLMLLIFLIYSCTKNHIFRNFRFLYFLFAIFSLSYLNYPIKLFIKSVYNNNSKFYGDLEVSSIKALGLNPKAMPPELQKASPGKNLVLIYLESIEKIYTDTSIFPLLTPNIESLMAEGITFNEFLQTEGTGCTISGMFSSQCGTPLLLPSMMSTNDMMSRGYFHKAVCLGDILKKAGYYQVYMGGARINFAGKSSFLLSHGYNEVKGFEELQSKLTDQNYYTGWGLYDDTLFGLAAQEYFRLADSGKPFNLTLLTLDTHPEGLSSRSCVPYTKKNNSMLNAVHCTDQLLMKFIKEISSHLAYKNTIVVIITDHLTLRSVAMKYYPNDYNRKLLFIILNTGQGYRNNDLITHMDVAPTVLSALGVVYDSQFLYGRNMLEGGKKTSQINYKDPKLIELTKHINSTYLSNDQSQSVFEHDILVEAIDSNKIKIGNENISSSYQGMPLSINRFIVDFAIVIFINDNGIVIDFMIVHLNDLIPLFLEKKDTDDSFILISPNKNLPLGLNYLTSTENFGLSVLFGKFTGPVATLGAYDKLDKLKISSKKINTLMKSFGQSEMIFSINPLQWLIKEYKNKFNELEMLPFRGAEAKSIKIPCIKMGPNAYKASIKIKNNGIFELEKVTSLKEIPENCCGAYFAFGSLYMPLKLDNGLIEIVKLKQIPNTKPLLLRSEIIGLIDGSIPLFENIIR